jgi:hypothetical protein
MFGGWVFNVLSWGYRRLVMVENVDFRYETKDESRDFHSKRRAFVIFQNELFFIEKGSPMSHWEFCLNRFNLSKEVFNQLVRGYYLDGDLVFYKDNFVYDEGVVQEALKYVSQIKSLLNLDEVKLYFGLIVGKPGEYWPYDYFYGVSSASNEIIRHS